VILLINFFQNIVPIFIQTLKPSNFLFELLYLHFLHAVGLVRIVIALISPMVLLQFLHVLIKLLDLLVFLIDLVSLLLDVEFEFFSLLFKPLYLELQVLFSGGLLTCATHSAAVIVWLASLVHHTHFSCTILRCSVLLLVFELRVDQTFTVLFRIVTLTG
jgi:hypothetical protein